jgi:hypothetical protein
LNKVTLGYVIDNLKLGEVALKIDGPTGSVKGFENTHEYTAGALYINEETKFLCCIDGRPINGLCLTPDSSPKDVFVIITRKQYENLLQDLIRNN